MAFEKSLTRSAKMVAQTEKPIRLTGQNQTGSIGPPHRFNRFRSGEFLVSPGQNQLKGKCALGPFLKYFGD
jgi:hypothetical protein